MKKNLLFIVGSIVVVFGLLLLFNLLLTDQNRSAELSDLTFVDYQGQPVSLGNFNGTPLVINSWASWCPFCVKELPDFATIQLEFGDQVQFIAINRSESRQVAQQYTNDLAISNRLVFLLDSHDTFYTWLGGFSMPETIFVDQAGTIVFHRRGPMDLTEIRQRTQSLINQN